MYICIYMAGDTPWVYVYIYICTYVYAHMPQGPPRVYMCIFVYICQGYICIHMYIYVYICSSSSKSSPQNARCAGDLIATLFFNAACCQGAAPGHICIYNAGCAPLPHIHIHMYVHVHACHGGPPATYTHAYRGATPAICIYTPGVGPRPHV